MTELQARPTSDARSVSLASPGAARVEAIGITKRFGFRAALRGVDLRVEPGERVALLGPNGAGKTTLLRILATLSHPTSGRLTIEGMPARRDAKTVRRHIGVVAHQPYLYDELTSEENLQFFARMYDVPNVAARITTVLEQVGLADRRRDRVRTFSRGMQQRLALARATLHEPTLLLLDEPDSGLDRSGIAMLADLMAQHTAAGGSVIFTTHDLHFALAESSRVVTLQLGRITLDTAPEMLTVEEIERRLGYR